MPTSISIQDTLFLINGQPTYAGRVYNGHSVEGLLMNSRMIQGIFDDENPATHGNWTYPDTGVWDADRNTDELCAALPEYRRHGLLAITVGFQGGGSIYTPSIMQAFRNSAFTDAGELKSAYLDRMARLIAAADACGMVVIVSLFYWVHVRRLKGREAIDRAIRNACGWLLESGHSNILLEIANEIRSDWPEGLRPADIHESITLAQSVRRDGRRLLTGCSVFPSDPIQGDAWLEAEDFTLPHGNDQRPESLRARLREIKSTGAYQKRPRPLLINEDSIYLENMTASLAEGASWGFYHQGFGSDYTDKRLSWKGLPRESEFPRLSGFQTVPVNWSVNDSAKRAFFARVAEITGGNCFPNR
jgi:hypothetical protein